MFDFFLHMCFGVDVTSLNRIPVHGLKYCSIIQVVQVKHKLDFGDSKIMSKEITNYLLFKLFIIYPIIYFLLQAFFLLKFVYT